MTNKSRREEYRMQSWCRAQQWMTMTFHWRLHGREMFYIFYSKLYGPRAFRGELRRYIRDGDIGRYFEYQVPRAFPFFRLYFTSTCDFSRFVTTVFAAGVATALGTSWSWVQRLNVGRYLLNRTWVENGNFIMYLSYSQYFTQKRHFKLIEREKWTWLSIAFNPWRLTSNFSIVHLESNLDDSTQ